MLWTAAGGIVTELISFWLLYERQKNNLNMKGAFWHILQRYVGSLIIVVPALVIPSPVFLRLTRCREWHSASCSSGHHGRFSPRRCASCCKVHQMTST